MTDQPKIDPSEVIEKILSFSDPTMLVLLFNKLGWSYSVEIEETVKLAKQDTDVRVKLAALKHLRNLIKECAETRGIISSVTKTLPGTDGSMTTFHAKRVAAALNPEPERKQIESKEISDGEERTTETQRPEAEDDRGSSGEETTSAERRSPIEAGNGRSGEEIPGGDGGGRSPGAEDQSGSGESEHPCVQHRLPTCDPELYPGVSGKASPEKDNYSEGRP
jgi:hypothetical protein